ncbi:MAG: hypothetical protein HYW48_12360 [Deltaproteobacteria bacterium]|nr:hypothetical protein [Deltaproteobacteria bacterium]
MNTWVKFLVSIVLLNILACKKHDRSPSQELTQAAQTNSSSPGNDLLLLEPFEGSLHPRENAEAFDFTRPLTQIYLPVLNLTMDDSMKEYVGEDGFIRYYVYSDELKGEGEWEGGSGLGLLGNVKTLARAFEEGPASPTPRVEPQTTARVRVDELRRMWESPRVISSAPNLPRVRQNSNLGTRTVELAPEEFPVPQGFRDLDTNYEPVRFEGGVPPQGVIVPAPKRTPASESPAPAKEAPDPKTAKQVEVRSSKPSVGAGILLLEKPLAEKARSLGSSFEGMVNSEVKPLAQRLENYAAYCGPTNPFRVAFEKFKQQWLNFPTGTPTRQLDVLENYLRIQEELGVRLAKFNETLLLPDGRRLGDLTTQLRQKDAKLSLGDADAFMIALSKRMDSVKWKEIVNLQAQLTTLGDAVRIAEQELRQYRSFRNFFDKDGPVSKESAAYAGRTGDGEALTVDSFSQLSAYHLQRNTRLSMGLEAYYKNGGVLFSKDIEAVRNGLELSIGDSFRFNLMKKFGPLEDRLKGAGIFSERVKGEPNVVNEELAYLQAKLANKDFSGFALPPARKSELDRWLEKTRGSEAETMVFVKDLEEWRRFQTDYKGDLDAYAADVFLPPKRADWDTRKIEHEELKIEYQKLQQ